MKAVPTTTGVNATMTIGATTTGGNAAQTIVATTTGGNATMTIVATTPGVIPAKAGIQRLPHGRQRGVALLTSILVVALAAVLVAMILDDGNTALARTRNLVRAEQADALADGLDAWAMQILLRDAAESPIDARDDIWAAGLPPTDVPGGTIMGAMSDLDGRFNLNNLVDGEQPNALELARFERLLRALALDPSIAEAVRDWIDADGFAETRGAEDPYYLQQRPPYRAANRAMAHVSELRLVRGIDANVYATLEPHVTALPGKTRINVNTATAPVLRSLAENLSEGMAERLVDANSRWDSTAAFRTELEQLGLVLDEAALATLAVESHYFRARAEIELDGIAIGYTSVIQRGPGLRVVARSRGAW